MKITKATIERFSHHAGIGRVDHLRREVTSSVLPASRGRMRIRKTWRIKADTNSQTLLTATQFITCSESEAARIASELSVMDIAPSDSLKMDTLISEMVFLSDMEKRSLAGCGPLS